jgi:hypothetical protein
MGRYNKFIVAGVGAALGLFFEAFGVSLGLESDWVSNATMVLTPILVYFVPNEQPPA